MTIKASPNASGSALLSALKADANALSVISGMPHSLLAQISAIAQAGCILSPRSAFVDAAHTTFATDGAFISSMKDLTGNGFDGAQSTGAWQPIFRSTGLQNSLPGLDFSANSGAGLKSTGNAFSGAGFSAGFTLYMIATHGGGIFCGIPNADFLELASTYLRWNFSLALTTTFTESWGPNNRYSDDLDGVVVLSWDGVTLTMGLNGRYVSAPFAGTPAVTGDICIGNSAPNSGFAFGGIVGDTWLFPGKHTSAQMDAIGALLAADSFPLRPCFLFIGDSIPAGAFLSSESTMNFPYQFCKMIGANPSNSLYINAAIGGTAMGSAGTTMIQDCQNQPYNRQGYVSSVRGKQNITFIFAGTNDLGVGTSAAQTFAYLKQLCAFFKAQGSLVAVGTILARTPVGIDAGFETQRQLYNPMVRAAAGTFFDMLVDVGNNSSPMGAPGSYSNTKLFGDGIHSTETGSTWIASQIVASVNNYFKNAVLLLRPVAPTVVTQILRGTTSGKISWSQPNQGVKKEFIANAAAYVNNSAVNQTITFPAPFLFTPSILLNDTGLTISVSQSTLTITAPNSATAYTGNITITGQ